MSDKKSTLLNESTIRRMMKLANIEALGDSFVSNHQPMAEDQAYSAKKEKPGKDKRKGAEKRGAEGTLAKTKGHGRVDYIKEDDAEDDDWGGNKGDESETHPGELDYEDELGPEDVEDEVALDGEPEGEGGEVTISDEEAQDIIALADKLRAALGDEEADDEEVETDIEAELDLEPSGEEEEVDIEEEPGLRYETDQEELYEAALTSLNLNVVDEDKKLKRENLKKKVYKRVVSRLLKESKK